MHLGSNSSKACMPVHNHATATSNFKTAAFVRSATPPELEAAMNIGLWVARRPIELLALPAPWVALFSSPQRGP